MDPYVRLRVGHFVYETQTAPNGGRNPRWNRVIHCQLPAGVDTIALEIYDECNFSMDELIAWAEIRIPQSVLRGETHEDWYPLSGKQGEGLEGSLDMVMSFNVSSRESEKISCISFELIGSFFPPFPEHGRPTAHDTDQCTGRVGTECGHRYPDARVRGTEPAAGSPATASSADGRRSDAHTRDVPAGRQGSD